MNVFHKVTLKFLIKNRTRTIVTIIGIILSASMICAVTTFAQSLFNYLIDNTIYRFGDWHGSVLNAPFKTCEEIAGSDKVKSVVYAQQLGYAVAEGSKNLNKPYIYLLGASDGFKDTMPVHITQGRFPENSGEILLPKHLEENGYVFYSLGDKITLNLGDRVDGGYILTQNNPYNTHDSEGNPIEVTEKLEVRETRTYTVVGFYERPSFEEYTAPGYTALTVADKFWGNNARFEIYFKMKNPKEAYSFMEEMGLNGSYNNSLLNYYGATKYENINNVIMYFVVIVIGLIMFGSIALIYNAFAISVSERTRQFGLLTSIGATRRQLKRMVMFEALFVSAIGIPLGVLTGIEGIGITLLFIGEKFETYMDYPLPLRVSVSPVSIAAAVVLALITVLISAWIPSKRATRVTAIEAIRQNQDINVKAKKVRTSKLTYKLFGLPGMLASKYFKRSKKKYRATVISLFMSIVLFVPTSTFTGYLNKSVYEGSGSTAYDITVSGFEREFGEVSPFELLKAINEDDGVKETVYARVGYTSASLPTEKTTEKFVKHYAHNNNLEPEDVDTVRFTIGLYFVDDAVFEKLLNDYRLDKSKYMNKNDPLAIAVDNMQLFDHEAGRFSSYQVIKPGTSELTVSATKKFEGYYLDYVLNEDNGKTEYIFKNKTTGKELKLSQDEAEIRHTVKIGKIIEEPPFYVEKGQFVSLIYPESMHEGFFPDGYDDLNYNLNYIRYYIKSDSHEKTFNAIKGTLADYKLELNIYNHAKNEEENRSLVTIVNVFSFGFIALISLIAAANVFNTISTNISLRRREFAMLKSVGMTEKGFKKMLNFECLLYGIKGLLSGLPVAIFISYLIYLAVREGFEFSFQPPWVAIGISVFSVFAVVFATMIYSMGKIKKDNLIDTLKNENF